jgi:hypothetical protein
VQRNFTEPEPPSPVSKFFVWLALLGRLRAPAAYVTVSRTTARAHFVRRRRRPCRTCYYAASSAERCGTYAFGRSMFNWSAPASSVTGGSPAGKGCSSPCARVVWVWWLIWKECNAQAFDANHAALNPVQLFRLIREEGSQWAAAGYRDLMVAAVVSIPEGAHEKCRVNHGSV